MRQFWVFSSGILVNLCPGVSQIKVELSMLHIFVWSTGYKATVALISLSALSLELSLSGFYWCQFFLSRCRTLTLPEILAIKFYRHQGFITKCLRKMTREFWSIVCLQLEPGRREMKIHQKVQSFASAHCLGSPCSCSFGFAVTRRTWLVGNLLLLPVPWVELPATPGIHNIECFGAPDWHLSASIRLRTENSEFAPTV